MRSQGPKYHGVLAPSERDAILAECRRGDYHNLDWLVKYYSQDEIRVDPEDDGISWDQLDAWARAASDDANRSPR